MFNRKKIVILLFALSFLLWSCDYGQLGGADKTDTYHPGDEIFEERLGFLCGNWSSGYDGYRIRKWSEFTGADKTKAQTLFTGLDSDNPRTYVTQDTPGSGDYIFLCDDYGYNYGYMGMVRAINIFNSNKNRGAIIIEYFEGADPLWLSETQDLAPGEKPFFGIYFRVLSQDVVQMANPVDQAAMLAGKFFYTEKESLQKAINAFNVENEAEFISWGIAFPQSREK